MKRLLFSLMGGIRKLYNSIGYGMAAERYLGAGAHNIYLETISRPDYYPSLFRIYDCGDAKK